MRLFSFRSKLILAMSLVVAGVTAAVLLATQRSVRQVYLKMYDDQFQAQFSYFTDSRFAQLKSVEDKCETIAKSPTLVSAMQSGRINDAYQILFEELRSDFKPQEIAGVGFLPTGAPAKDRDKDKDKEREKDKNKDNGSAKPAGNAHLKTQDHGEPSLRKRSVNAAAQDNLPKNLALPYVRLTNAKGEPIEPQIHDPESKKFFGKTKRQEELREFARSLPPEAMDGQDVGYKALEFENRPLSLHEMIVTPIRENIPNAPVIGALNLGVPVRDFAEMTMSKFNKALTSGVWVDGKVYSKTIPESAYHEVEAHVAEGIKQKRTPQERSPITIDGEDYLIFFRILNAGSDFPPAAEVALYSLADYAQAAAHLRNLVLEFGGMALLVGIGLILLISDGFSKPIEELSTATRRIGQGHFDTQVPVRSRDELGELAASFNEMAAGLGLKEKYKSVLSQVTDPQIADELISGNVTLGGERREVSMLFCDIRGFTQLTEGMPPEHVIALLNEHMTALTRIVHEHCGVVDKFVGDMLMAIFGAPKSYGTDPTHAARCALAMIEERRALNCDSPHQVEIGIGLASGVVVAGCMGSEDRMDYTVLGERVNLAARLCSHAGRMEVLIDETTLGQLPPDSQFTSLPALRLKGFTETVEAFRLEAVGSASVSADDDEPRPLLME